MEEFLNWIDSVELSTMQIVGIILFFLYLLFAGIGFAFSFIMGRGYLDLAKGLRRILERQDAAGQMDDIPELAREIHKYYDSYAKYNPSISQRYSGIISWMDDILLQTNMFNTSKHKRKRRFGIWFDEYYDALKKVQSYFEKEHPYYRCTSSHAQILEDMSSLRNAQNGDFVDKLLIKTEDEFVRMTRDGKKNERTNYISIAIGVAGILVSVLLTILQMF